MKIKIIPIGDVPQEIIEHISKELRKTYFSFIDEVEFESKLDMPKRAYNQRREQYKAGVIQRHIFTKTTTPAEGKILGITMKDLYSQGLNYVFGQAKKTGKTALISLHRLRPRFWNQEKDQSLLLERAAKEAIHEIGHTLGLSHCDKKNCVMTFSNRITQTDRKEKSFCESCREKIERKEESNPKF